MKLRLFMLNILGGPMILQKFKLSNKNIEEHFFSDNFALFSSYENLDYWESVIDKENEKYSYVLIDLTDNANEENLRGFFDIKMKNSNSLIELILKFGGHKKERKVIKSIQEIEEELEVILDKVSESGVKSLNDEEREFLKNYKQ